MTDAIVDTYQQPPSRRAGLHRRRRHAEERPAPGGGRPERRHPAEDHRQRHRHDGPHLRLRHRAADRHRGDRPAAFHGDEPRADHRGGGHGPPRRLAGSGGGHRRRRRCDSDAGNPLRCRTNRRGHPRRTRAASASASWWWPRGPCRRTTRARWMPWSKRSAKAELEKNPRSRLKEKLRKFHRRTRRPHDPADARVWRRLTGQESRLTILGHLQRGGTPSAADRVFATWLGTECADVLNERKYGVMLALQGTT